MSYNYPILYLYKSPNRTLFSDNYFWTMCSADSDYCKKYRDKEQLARCNQHLIEIGKVVCTDGGECSMFQKQVNEVFKAWTNGGGMQIKIDMTTEDFVSTVNAIYNNKDNLLPIMTGLLKNYKHPVRSGKVYLVRCKNNKLKIGTASNIMERFEQLKLEENNQAESIIDMFDSKDTPYDEAMLHLLCEDYKTNGNKKVTCMQAFCNSELFENRQEVIEIWNKYKENKHV